MSYIESIATERMRAVEAFQTDQDEIIPVDQNKKTMTEVLRNMLNRLSAPDLTLPQARVLRTNLMDFLDAVKSRDSHGRRDGDRRSAVRGRR